MDLIKASSNRLNNPWILMIYGKKSTGKTGFLCGSDASKNGGLRTVMFDLEHGSATIDNPWFLQAYPYADPFRHFVKSSNGKQAFNQLEDDTDDLFTKHLNEFDTYGLDGISPLRMIALMKGIEITGDMQKTATNARYKTTGIISPEISDYAEEMNVMDQFVNNLVEECKIHNKNLIVAAHERIQFKPLGKIGQLPVVDKIRPGFTGRTFPDNVTRNFDDVWYLTRSGKGERALYNAQTLPDEIITAGTRHSGIVKENEINPKFTEIYNRIQTSKSK